MARLKAVIIGGGASGMMAAITMARTLKHMGVKYEITIAERLDRVGKKLLSTGNGTCNLTNLNRDHQKYHGGDIDSAMKIIDRHTPQDTIKFFESIGVLCKYNSERVYPYSLQASGVLDSLRDECKRLGITEKCSVNVNKIERKDGKISVIYDDSNTSADIVILSSGGRTAPSLGGNESGYALAKMAGHSITRIFPALTQVKSPSPICKSLKGIKFEGAVTVLIDGKEHRRESGEILFTDYGFSGPPILQISRIISELYDSKTIQISLDLMPEYKFEQIYELINSRINIKKNEPSENLLAGMLNKRLSQAVMKAAGILPLSKPCSSLDLKEIKNLAKLISDWRFNASGVTGWQNSQATAGGIPLSEIDPETMQSRKFPALYLTGEILDIDGDCGGFNLQWAWSTGYLAGVSASRSLKENSPNA